VRYLLLSELLTQKMSSYLASMPRVQDRIDWTKELPYLGVSPSGLTRDRSLAAIVTSSAREPASIFRITLPRWAFTVISLIPS